MNDPFLRGYDAAEVGIAAEFLSNWLPFLSRGLCKSCTRTLSDGIRSLRTGNMAAPTSNVMNPNGCNCEDGEGNYCAQSSGHYNDCADTRSLGSWKGDDGIYEPSVEASPTSQSLGYTTPLASTVSKKSWADIAQEDELEAEEESEVRSKHVDVDDCSVEETPVNGVKARVALSREQREYFRFNYLQREKNFACYERIDGKLVNILEGLELHKGVFSAAEQKRIVEYVEKLREMGRNGELKERTYTAPQKWMRGKGRVTLQFGCCYNYAPDKNRNPPGILRNEMVDPLPHFFKVMIKRLIRWSVLPPSCVPDSCIVNIYEEGDCIPPHIDNHDFLRPFCTVSFLSECEILFGSNLKIVGPGEFSGTFRLPLPVGSVLVINGNGADVAKHCVPAVPSKRISITFRKMDELKRPSGYVPEPDLQGLKPMSGDLDRFKQTSVHVNVPEPDSQVLQQPSGDLERLRNEESGSSGRSFTGKRGRGGRGGSPWVRQGPRRRFPA